MVCSTTLWALRHSLIKCFHTHTHIFGTTQSLNGAQKSWCHVEQKRIDISVVASAEVCYFWRQSCYERLKFQKVSICNRGKEMVLGDPKEGNLIAEYFCRKTFLFQSSSEEELEEQPTRVQTTCQILLLRKVV